MKYKKRVENLRISQLWWDKLPQSVKNSTTRPGSMKQRTAKKV